MFKDAMKKFVGRFLRLPEKPGQELDKSLALKYLSALTQAGNQTNATEILHEAVCEILEPRQLTIFLHDPQRDGYSAQLLPSESPLDGRFVPEEAEIAVKLKETEDVLYIQERFGISPELSAPDQPRDGWTSQLFCPVPGKAGLLGWLILGESQSRKKYSTEQIDILKSLTLHYSAIYEKIGIENTAQKQLQSLTLIDQITAEINHCHDLDKFLTNVFEKINLCFSFDRFSIVLWSPENNLFQRQFLIDRGENNISSKQPVKLSRDFPESNVIKTRKPQTITDNGTWFVAPLIAQDQAIGAFSLGHYREKAIFDPSDLNLAHVIGGLITEAVIKYGGLDNLTQQTQQLSQMREINQQRHVSFDLKQLLQEILDDAVENLNASSGVLVVHDEKTQEPAFQVTAGPVGKEIQDLGLQIREGHSGGYYQTAKSIILNQIDTERSLFKDLKPIAAEKIDNLMIVPMVAQSKNWGFIELINKHGQKDFTKKDRLILEDIAGQAANALHQSAQSRITNHDLEQRIEKLSVILQIDRELNATRDIHRALQITLESALLHTRAQMGTIGIIDETFEVLEQIWQFMPETGLSSRAKPINLNKLPWLTKSMLDPQVHEFGDFARHFGIPEKFKWHYPILSHIANERYVLLVLHLDKPDKFTSQDPAFLKDLTDHAHDALMNAILFEDLHDAIQAKNEFISFISHELKNPLTVIKGYADILRKGMAGEVNAEQKDYLTTIAHNVRRMNTFIKDLSDQCYIETKSLRLVFESAPVFEVIYEVLQTYEAQIVEKNITIKEAIQKPMANVWCDRLRLNQILSNLISNAIKYTPEGGRVEIGAEESANTWDKDGAAEVVHFWVSDNGYGISQEDQIQLFTKFFRGTDPRIQKIPGSGLGLRISKSLTEMMGGQIWFESTEGQGSTFHFTVPI